MIQSTAEATVVPRVVASSVVEEEPGRHRLCVELERRVAEGELEIPLLPTVATEVLAMVASEECDGRRLAALIHRDQAIASHLLRIANSPLYSPREPIVSLTQAVSRLGLVSLREIVYTVSVRAKVLGEGAFEERGRALWRHSLATATYAREIARMRRRNVEGAFLCGLLHDIGKPVLLSAIAEASRALRLVPDRALVGALLEEHHVAVGADLATKWSLPPQVVEAIAHHHDHRGATSYRELAATTCLADQLAYVVLDGEGLDKKRLPGPEVVVDLGLYSDDVVALLDRADVVREAVGALSSRRAP